MDFSTDIFLLLPSKNKTISFDGLTLPDNKDVFFRAKQKEIIDQYTAARNFLIQTDTKDWSYWFAPSDIENANRFFKLTLTANFFEAALMFYNVVVDLSWTICYLAAEFALYKGGTTIDLSKMTSIEDSVKIIRDAEKNVTSPTAETTPFIYLKQMNTEYEKAIGLITEFWGNFANSNLRQTYNFIKHKGKPLYNEIDEIDNTRLFSFFQKNLDGNEIRMVSDIRDVQYKISLTETIKELFDFDEKVLYPYIAELFSTLEEILKPSPLI